MLSTGTGKSKGFRARDSRLPVAAVVGFFDCVCLQQFNEVEENQQKKKPTHPDKAN
jgi:hypothetical protein